jgi:uncharacterized protein (TIGR03437 family)
VHLFSWSLVSAILVCVPPLSAGLATAYQDATHLYLENDVLKIAVLRTSGSLDGIIHKQSGVNLQSKNVNNYQGIWGMSLNTSAGVIPYVGNANTTSFTGTFTTGANGASLELMWRGLLPSGAPALPNVNVKAQISVRTDTPLSYWTIEVDGLGTNSVISVSYPFILGIDKLGQSGDDDVLLVPQMKGTLFHNPIVNLTVPTGSSYPAGYASMQLLAYFDKTAGFYLAADDTQGNTKTFWWGKTTSPAGDFQINMVSYPTGSPADTFTVPYNMIVGVTQGDWYAAADIYRTWADQQSWAQQSRTKKVPTWLHDMPLARWECTHGCQSQPDRSYANFLQDMQQSQQSFGVPGMGQLNGWEKSGAYAYGDYFPPQEGWSAFDATVQNLRPGKLWLMPSGLFLDTATDLYKSGTMASSAMLDRQGHTLTTVGADPSQQWAYMDFSTDPWRQHVVDSYAMLASHGADLLQLDSSMTMGPQDCYNPLHSHLPGKGGNWQTQGWIDITQRIAGAVRAVNPNTVLSAEEPAEVYLPYFALHYSGDSIDQFENRGSSRVNQEPVPLFQYVYHDSILFADFMGPAILDGSFFRLGLARDLTWGQLPQYQVDLYPSSLDAAAHAYLQAAITARTTYAKKFLVDGIMLPPPLLNVPATQVSWIVWSEGSRQAAGQYPSIQESAWRASDDSVGIVLTNIAPASVTFSLPIAYGRLGLPAGAAYTVQAVGAASGTALDANMTKDSAYSITLASQQILLVTLTQKATGSPASVTTSAGDGQGATINTPFLTTLQATVRDSNGAPVPNVTVTFTALGSGPGGSFPNSALTATAITNSAGVATAPAFTANGAAGGPYRVTASVAGVATPAIFALTNVNPAPRISAVVNAEGGSPTIAPNTWVEIDGTNLAPPGDSRLWQGADFVNSQLPTQLDGVSVTINGKAAYVYYISPGQVNVLTPPDAMQGAVQVQLTSDGFTAGTSVQAQQVAPSLFVINGGPYVLATHADGSLLGPASLYPGVTTPARPGETIVVYGNGFGTTSPPVVSGSTGQSGKLPASPLFKLGGNSATVLFAGVVSPGLYQFNVVVPQSTPDGDNALTVTYGGLATQSGTLLSVQH